MVRHSAVTKVIDGAGRTRNNRLIVTMDELKSQGGFMALETPGKLARFRAATGPEFTQSGVA